MQKDLPKHGTLKQGVWGSKNIKVSIGEKIGTL